MSLKSFISGEGPNYRLPGAAPTSAAQSLVSLSTGEVVWGASGGGGDPEWNYTDSLEVYAKANPGGASVGSVRCFVNATGAKILPSGTVLARVSVITGGVTIAGLDGPTDNYVQFTPPGGRSPFAGDTVSVAASMTVSGGAALVPAGAACLGESGLVRISVPDGATEVSVRGVSFTYISAAPL